MGMDTEGRCCRSCCCGRVTDVSSSSATKAVAGVSSCVAMVV
jgi:hypothetical protein